MPRDVLKGSVGAAGLVLARDFAAGFALDFEPDLDFEADFDFDFDFGIVEFTRAYVPSLRELFQIFSAFRRTFILG